MFDSIDPSRIPPGQDDAGYVDGRWRTFTALHGPHNLSVAVFASDDADALDDEPGDATNAQAGGWVKRELGLGHWKPCVYTSVSNLPALLAALASAGISRGQVRIWTAHYTYRSHRCTRACNSGLAADFVADATQWTDRSGGRNLDESTIADNFFATPAAAAPAPSQPPYPVGDKMIHPVNVTTDANGNGWTLTTIPWSAYQAISLQKGYPPVDGYWPGAAGAEDRNDCVLAVVTGFRPNTAALAFVLASQ